MKKLIFAILAVLALLTACVMQAPAPAEQPAAPAEEPTAAPEPTAPAPRPVEPEAPEEPAPEAEPEAVTAPVPLYGAVPIGKTEAGDAIDITDYEMDRTENTAALTKIRFTIRNPGREPIRPRVVMQLTGEGFNVNKIWDYDRLLNGYKFEKDVKLNIELDAPKLMKIIKLTVLDMDQSMKELGSDTKQFIPIPPKK